MQSQDQKFVQTKYKIINDIFAAHKCNHKAQKQQQNNVYSLVLFSKNMNAVEICIEALNNQKEVYNRFNKTINY